VYEITVDDPHVLLVIVHSVRVGNAPQVHWRRIFDNEVLLYELKYSWAEVSEEAKIEHLSPMSLAAQEQHLEEVLSA